MRGRRRAGGRAERERSGAAGRGRPSSQRSAAAPGSRRDGRAGRSRSHRASGAALLVKRRRRGPGVPRPLYLLCIGYCQRQLAESVNKPGAISAARSSFAQRPVPGGGAGAGARPAGRSRRRARGAGRPGRLVSVPRALNGAAQLRAGPIVAAGPALKGAAEEGSGNRRLLDSGTKGVAGRRGTKGPRRRD